MQKNLVTYNYEDSFCFYETYPQKIIQEKANIVNHGSHIKCKFYDFKQYIFCSRYWGTLIEIMSIGQVQSGWETSITV